MPEELLQRLRDIHYPDAPGWFPPAPGWWLMAALLLGAGIYLARLWRRRSRNKAPYALAKTLLDQAHSQFSQGEIGAREYLDTSNQIIKRLLIHIQHSKTAVELSGPDWLAELDRLHGGNQFSQGPGRLLGNERFARALPDTVPELQNLLQKLVQRLQTHQATSVTPSKKA